MTRGTSPFKQASSLSWKTSKDLGVISLPWLFVVSAVYRLRALVATKFWGGMAYFILYAVVGVMFSGVGLPLSDFSKSCS